MQLLLFLTQSLFWPFKVSSLPKTLLTLPALSFHRQFFIPRDGMGRKAGRIESPENTSTNSYLRAGFWVQKRGIPFISIHLCYPLSCITYNHPSVAMVHMKLSIVSGLTDNNREHRWPLLLFPLPLCPRVLDGVWKMLVLLHPDNIDHHKSCCSNNNKMKHKEFQKFLPPSDKNTQALTSETEGLIMGIERKKKKQQEKYALITPA